MGDYTHEGIKNYENNYLHQQEQFTLRAMKELGSDLYEYARSHGPKGTGLSVLDIQKEVKHQIAAYSGPISTATGSILTGILDLSAFVPKEMADKRAQEIRKDNLEDATLHAMKELGPEFYEVAKNALGGPDKLAEAALKELTRLHAAGVAVRKDGKIIVGVMDPTNLGLKPYMAATRKQELDQASYLAQYESLNPDQIVKLDVAMQTVLYEAKLKQYLGDSGFDFTALRQQHGNDYAAKLAKIVDPLNNGTVDAFALMDFGFTSEQSMKIHDALAAEMIKDEGQPRAAAATDVKLPESNVPQAAAADGGKSEAIQVNRDGYGHVEKTGAGGLPETQVNGGAIDFKQSRFQVPKNEKEASF